jgi:4-hydroxybenzoate polyprenyltransferase
LNQSLTDQSAKAGLGRFAALIEAMRIPHWVKNGFVAAPLIFSGRFDSLSAWGRCLAAVLAYCLLSSGVYLINDIADRKSDQAHPVKKYRPIPAGRLSVQLAWLAAVVLLVLGLGLAAMVECVTYSPDRPLFGYELIVWTVSYLVLNLLYSFWLKNIAIMDVIVIALGFVLRAMAGAAAIVVPISPWLVLCTFTLCLFIALAKRRSELSTLSAEIAHASRPASLAYDQRDIEYMLTVSTAMAILTYCLYCVAPQTIQRIGSAHMIWTIPLVVYGMFRYNRVTRQAGDSDAVSVVLHDKVLWAVLAVYLVVVVLVLRFGSHPSVAAVLDVAWELKRR